MYPHVVVAGTFDRLHKGHVAVLRRAFAEGERVTIGLTTDEYVKKFKIFNFQFSIFNEKFKVQISNFQTRKGALEQVLKKRGWLHRATIIPLDDPYGPVVPQSSHDATVPDVEAIVVSPQTRGRAEEINRLRIEAGWKPLAIVEVAMVAAEDLHSISSTRVRKKEIDRAGRLIMPDNLRPELQKPLGTVLRGKEVMKALVRLRRDVIPAPESGSRVYKGWIPGHLPARAHAQAWRAGARNDTKVVITVGDVATKTLLDAGVVPSLAIIDGKVGRKPFHETLQMLQPEKVKPFQARAVKSGPGYISQEAMETIQQWATHPLKRGSRIKSGMTSSVVLFIDGEEDLLALPAIAQAPLGAVVYYGQPDKGLVEVVVTKSIKQYALALLARFLS